MKKNYTRRLTLCGLAILAVVMPLAVSASVVRVGEEVSLPQGVVVDDVYAAAGNVSSVAAVQGDLMSAGGNLFLSGSVTEDLVALGGSINIVGNVGDDLRIAGGNITVSGSVGDDLLVAGGQVSVISGSSIGGDVLMGGGRIVLDGTVRGNVKVGAGEIVINGVVDGNVDIVADKVVLGERAIVKGTLSYRSGHEIVMKDGSQVLGEISYTPVKNKLQGDRGFIGVSALFKALITFITALLLQWIFGNVAVRLVEKARQNVWSNLGWGFVLLVVTPIAVVIGLITIVGAPVALLVFLAYAADLLISCLFVSVFLGGVLWKYFKKHEFIVLNWKTALIGSVATLVLGFIPIFGWILLLVTFLIVLGALVQFKKDYFVGLRRGE